MCVCLFLIHHVHPVVKKINASLGWFLLLHLEHGMWNMGQLGVLMMVKKAERAYLKYHIY